MPTILCKYALREILAPMLIALVALSFIIFLSLEVPGRDEHMLLLLLRLFMRDDIAKTDVIQTFLLALPSTILFILPMSLLIGIIIGIGRMTLDLEVRAIQTGGINIIKVFAPVIIAAAGLSAVAAFLTWGPEPRMVGRSVKIVGKLLVSEFENLEPGQVYDELFDESKGLNLYFHGRDPESRAMKSVTLMLDRRAFQDESEREAAKRERKNKIDKLEDELEKRRITREEFERLEHEIRLKEKAETPVMIFASEASFGADPETGRVDLNLYKGSIHMADTPSEPKVAKKPEDFAASENGATTTTVSASASAAEGAPALPIGPVPESPAPLVGEAAPAAQRDYAILKFGKFSKSEVIAGNTDSKSRLRLMTGPELMARYNDKSVRRTDRFRARATYWERWSLSLESLVFALIGVPLAVRVRPTGKSVGIVLAFALILVYHWLMRTGYAMIEADRSIGPLMIFAPNILFAAGGGFLWWRAITR